METEIMQTVMNEVLGELKEIKQQQAGQTKILSGLTGKVESFEQKVCDIKVFAPPVDTSHIEFSVADGINRIKSTIEAQPKCIIRQFRVLLFPEHYADQYYKIVFGRLLLWIIILVLSTYLFALGKQFINNQTLIEENEMFLNHYKKAWQYLYKQENKNGKKRMDSAWLKEYE